MKIINFEVNRKDKSSKITLIE